MIEKNSIEVQVERGEMHPLLPTVPCNVVYHEDCMEGLKRFPDKYFDLAIVDPPYGFRTAKTGILNFRKDKQEKEWNVAPTAEYFNELKRVSKNQIVWGGELLSRIMGKWVQVLYLLAQRKPSAEFCRWRISMDKF